jgi:hypothetical protein
MPISLKVRFHGIILDQRGDKRDEKVVEGKGGIPGDPHDELPGSLGTRRRLPRFTMYICMQQSHFYTMILREYALDPAISTVSVHDSSIARFLNANPFPTFLKSICGRIKTASVDAVFCDVSLQV